MPSVEKLIEVYGDLCYWCDTQVEVGPLHTFIAKGGTAPLRMATREHLKPCVRGGCDCIANLRVACMDCNSKRGHHWDGVENCDIHADSPVRGYPGMQKVLWEHYGSKQYQYDSYTEAY